MFISKSKHETYKQNENMRDSTQKDEVCKIKLQNKFILIKYENENTAME